MAVQQSDNYSIVRKNSICFFNGIIAMPLITTEHVRELHKLKIRESDIILCTFPKSGTHWLIHIIRSLVMKKNKHYYIDIPMMDKAPLESEIQSDPTLNILENKEEFENAEPPRIMASHLLWDYLPKRPDVKYFYMYRNPKDIILSAFHHFKNFASIEPFSGSFDDMFNIFIETELFGFIQHLKCYFKQKVSPNFMFISYEELHSNFNVKLHEIATFIGVELTEELYDFVVKETSFETMKQNNSVKLKLVLKEGEHFLWKGVSGHWREYLTPEQIKTVDDILYEKLDEELLKQLNCL